MKKKQTYYNLEKILSYGCQYNMIIGQRSNGKTYAALKMILENYCKSRKQGVILRRYEEDFRGARGRVMFQAINNDKWPEKLTRGKWTDIYYFGGQWFLCTYDDDGKRITDKRPFCYGLSLAGTEHDKSTSYPDVTTVVFDEFLTRTFYLQDEFVLFCNQLSTIIRDRADVIILMLGNTVSKYCPYFREMGITDIKKQKQGTIDVYSYGNSGLKVAVEYCAERVSVTGSDAYFAFQNPQLKMIRSGAWELEFHDHLPRKYRPADVLMVFYIDFDGELLQGNIVMPEQDLFIYIHAKTSPLQNRDEDLIYSDKRKSAPNWRRSVWKDSLPVSRKICRIINDGQVYFSDNETGEVFQNYLKWAVRNN